MKLSNRHLVFLAGFCLTLLFVVLWAMYAEYNRPWKQYQKEFNELEYKVTETQYQNLLLESPTLAKVGSTRFRGGKGGFFKQKSALLKARLEGIPGRRAKIKQLWLRELGETDRCMTCHPAEDRPGFEEAPHPFRTHSGAYLKHHPVERFGCVVCHEGQGAALTVSAAHGDAENWQRPLLKGSHAQSSCGRCHFMGQGLPVDTELTGGAEFMKGWRMFLKGSCLGCHKLQGYKRPGRIAPSLTNIGNKLNRAWLVKWLKNPGEYLPGSKMPRYDLDDEEAGYVADYLMSLKSFQSDLGKGVLQYAPAAHAKFSGKNAINNGKHLVNSLGCLGCHKINGRGNDFAPDFSNIGSKVKRDWLIAFLRRPASHDPKTIIPDFSIPEEDIPDIAAYLMSRGVLQYAPTVYAEIPDNNSIDNGRALVTDLGCAGCHNIEGLPFRYSAPELDAVGGKRMDELTFNNLPHIEETLANWLGMKIMEPAKFATDTIRPRMPAYNFSKEETESLVTFLLSLRDGHIPARYIKLLNDTAALVTRGRKVIEKYNCLGCHKIGKDGGNLGPDLTAEGKKSRPEWLFAFLKRPRKIRPVPILRAGMPDFHLSAEEVRVIIAYLFSLSEEPFPYAAVPVKKIRADDIWSGEKLYMEVFACISCHSVNGQGGQVGPEHTDLASRLKRQWIQKWLQNPEAIKPDVRMPRYKFRDWEFEALTNYLMTLGTYRFVRVTAN